MGHYYSGQYDEADHWFAEAVERAPAVQQWLVAASSLAYRSLIAGTRGDQSEQGRLAKSAVTLAEDRSIDDIDGEVYLALGEDLRLAENSTMLAPSWSGGSRCCVTSASLSTSRTP